MATSGQIRWPPAGNSVAAHGQLFMAADNPGAPLRGYLVHWTGATPVGIMLRASEVGLRPGISAMCALCRTPQPSGQVTLFTAPRAGEAGRNGNSIGTYICDDLACSFIIRIVPTNVPLQPPADVVAARANGLLARVEAFASDVMKTV